MLASQSWWSTYRLMMSVYIDSAKNSRTYWITWKMSINNNRKPKSCCRFVTSDFVRSGINGDQNSFMVTIYFLNVKIVKEIANGVTWTKRPMQCLYETDIRKFLEDFDFRPLSARRHPATKAASDPEEKPWKRWRIDRASWKSRRNYRNTLNQSWWVSMSKRVLWQRLSEFAEFRNAAQNPQF